jgi:hypothetical protein
MSLRTFAAHLGVDERTVTKWEAGGAAVHPRHEMQAMLDTVLRQAGDEARERFAQATRLPHEAVTRRTAVGFGFAASVALPGLALEMARHGLVLAGGAEPSATAVDEWHAVVREYGESYLHSPPGVLLDRLTVDLAVLGYAINAAEDPRTLTEFRRAGAMLAVLTALTLGNLGQVEQAGRWWRSAKQMADRAEDRHTVAWVRGNDAVRGLYEGRQPAVVLRLVDEAYDRGAADAPDALPWLLAAKAQAMAMQGRSAEAITALRDLEEAASRLPSDTGRADQPFILSAPASRVRFAECFVHAYLGDMRRTEAAHEAALALYPPSYARGSAQLDLLEAICRARTGDGAAAARHAGAVITALSEADRIRPVIDLGHQVLAAVRHEAPTAALRACLALPGV